MDSKRIKFSGIHMKLTHWGWVTHICIGNLVITGSDNGLSPGRRQAIIWTNAGILLIGPLGKNFNEIFTEIHTFSLTKIYLKMSSGKWPSCLGLNVLKDILLWWNAFESVGKLSSILFRPQCVNELSQHCFSNVHRLWRSGNGLVPVWHQAIT